MNGISRRDWLLAAGCWAEVLRAQTPKFEYFTAADGAEIEALAEVILPGAKEAGVIWFIDRALAGHDKDQQPLYIAGLRNLRIAALSTEQQTAIVREIENTDFFKAVRQHTILGFFGDPRHGGNRNGASEKLLGYRQTMIYSPPFGYYDAEAAAAK